jgi:hypothetical protein
VQNLKRLEVYIGQVDPREDPRFYRNKLVGLRFTDTIKKNTEPLTVPSKVVGPEINVENTTVILPVVLYGCRTWSLTLREELD